MEDVICYEICTPLTKEITIGGGQKKVVILNSTFGFAMFYLTGSFFILPFIFIFHILIIVATKNDQNFFDIFIRYFKQKDIYYS